jgi:small subunit ribosomal protein S18
MAINLFSTDQKHPLGKRRCTFCTNQLETIDYKDLRTLRHFVNGFMRIKPRYYTGVCIQHQRKLANAIKWARHMALLPFILNVKTPAK